MCLWEWILWIMCCFQPLHLSVLRVFKPFGVLNPFWITQRRVKVIRKMKTWHCKHIFSVSLCHLFFFPFTLKMGSKTSWLKVRGSFWPSGPVAVLLNFPAFGSKYLYINYQTTSWLSDDWHLANNLVLIALHVPLLWKCLSVCKRNVKSDLTSAEYQSAVDLWGVYLLWCKRVCGLCAVYHCCRFGLRCNRAHLWDTTENFQPQRAVKCCLSASGSSYYVKHVSVWTSCLPIAPQFLHHVLHFLTPRCWSQLSISFGSELCHIHLGKLLQGESPAVEAWPKPNSTNNRIDLRKKKRSAVYFSTSLSLSCACASASPWCSPWAPPHPLHKWR